MRRQIGNQMIQGVLFCLLVVLLAGCLPRGNHRLDSARGGTVHSSGKNVSGGTRA